MRSRLPARKRIVSPSRFAGQKYNSALQYHFETREVLILLTMPVELAEERLIIGVGNIMNAAAGRAQLKRLKRRRGQRLGLEAFVANQIDMFVGAVTARVSEKTLAAIG